MVTADYIPKNKEDLFKNCLTSKLWRLSNLYKIKTKDGKSIKFKPNKAQQKYFASDHPLKIVLKARQLGMTTGIQIDMLDDCLFESFTNAGVIAHNLVDAQSFFSDKIKFAYDNLPDFLLDFDDFKATSKSARELSFGNNSVVRVGTGLRSGTYKYLHISEHGKLCAKHPDKAEEVRTGALNTVGIGQKITIESTAEGRHGDFYEFCQTAIKKQGEVLTEMDYEFFFFPWYEDDGYVLEADFEISPEHEAYFESLGVPLTDAQKRWYIKKEETQGDKMKQEYPSTPEESFEASIEGAYFAKQMRQIRSKDQITKVPIVPHVPIETYWDLGRDTTSIWFFQKVGFDLRFIDYFENSGEGMEYYVHALKTRTDGGRPYSYGTCFLPHDGTRKGMASNMSPADILYQNGFDCVIVPKTPSKNLSIERARQVLPLCWFDKTKCATGLTRLDNYRKVWDDKLETWKKEPLHDIASHGADSFMTFADSYQTYTDEEYDDERRVGNATTGY